FSPGAFQWPALLETGIGVDAGDRAGLCHPFPSCRGSQNGPRREGFASPRNAGAPLTAAGRSERTPPSKRERGRVKSNQTTAVLAPFSTAIDTPPPCASPLEFQFSAVAVYQACGSVANPVWSKFPHALKR